MKINRLLLLCIIVSVLFNGPALGHTPSRSCEIMPIRWHINQYTADYTVVTVYAWLDGTFIDGLTFTSAEAGYWVTQADPVNEFDFCIDEYTAFLDHSINQLSTLQPPQSPFQILADYNRFLRTVNPYQTYLPAVYQDA